MLARLSAFVIWALVAASVVFWGLRLFVRAPAAPVYTVAVADAGALRGDLARLLGTAPVAAAPTLPIAEASARFRLLGIVAPRQSGNTAASGHGIALIAVDGKLPKAYVVGARLDNDLLLQSVSLRTAMIAPASGAPAITLELPPPTGAATGTLPIGGRFGGDAPSPLNAAPPPYVAPQTAPQPVPQNLPPPSGARPVGSVPGGLLPRPDASAPSQ